MNESVEDGVSDEVMPFFNGQFAGGGGGAKGVSVFDDFEQVAPVIGGEFGQCPVVDGQDFGLGHRGEELGNRPSACATERSVSSVGKRRYRAL